MKLWERVLLSFVGALVIVGLTSPPPSDTSGIEAEALTVLILAGFCFLGTCLFHKSESKHK